MFEEYKNVWVYTEQRGGKLMPVALELLGEGRRLSREISEETKVCAVLVGSGTDHLTEELYAYGADTVYQLDHPLLKNYTTDGYTKVITEAIQEYKPEIVLFGATHIGRDLAPRIAARLDTGLTADCTRLDINTGDYIHYLETYTTASTAGLDPEDGNKGLKQTRPAFHCDAKHPASDGHGTAGGYGKAGAGAGSERRAGEAGGTAIESRHSGRSAGCGERSERTGISDR